MRDFLSYLSSAGLILAVVLLGWTTGGPAQGGAAYALVEEEE